MFKHLKKYMAKKTTKKVTAPKKVAGAKKETAAKVKAPKSEPKKPDVSFDKFLPPAPEQEKAAAPIENVDFDKFVSETPATTSKKGRVPKKELKSLDYAPEVIDPSTEAFKSKIAGFTGTVFAQIFKQKQILVELAEKEFGEKNLNILTGLSNNEVAFEVAGYRIPEEGFFFIRTQ